jgi:DNA-binding CsgD family transcriptional regulator
MDDGRQKLAATWVALVSLGVGVIGTLDLIGDLAAGTGLAHLIIEGAAAAGGLIGFAWLGSQLRAVFAEARESRKLAAELELHLVAARGEAERWKKEAAGALAGLSEAIDAQLERWNLTGSEKEVALLLLKGLSHREISTLRGTSEPTVRQQSRALYKKAGLAGRHELAAFFLEDLMLPGSKAPAEKAG